MKKLQQPKTFIDKYLACIINHAVIPNRHISDVSWVPLPNYKETYSGTTDHINQSGKGNFSIVTARLLRGFFSSSENRKKNSPYQIHIKRAPTPVDIKRIIANATL